MRGDNTNFTELESLEMHHGRNRVDFDVVDNGLVKGTADSCCRGEVLLTWRYRREPKLRDSCPVSITERVGVNRILLDDIFAKEAKDVIVDFEGEAVPTHLRLLCYCILRVVSNIVL